MTAPPAAIPFQTAETHLPSLVMVGDRVLKAKKPGWTEFLDLTTTRARQEVAEREVRLNRRLAPDVYGRLPRGTELVLFDLLGP